MRRLTGGGAIHHIHELTFSIAIHQSHPLYRGEVQGSYERVHGLLIQAFEQLGVKASLRGTSPLASDVEGSGMCFHKSTPLDIAWNGCKGVGSAQRRRAVRVLHHGSIKLNPSDLDTGVAGLREFQSELTPKTLAAHIREEFERSLALRFETSEPSKAELRHTEERRAFFSSPEHLARR